MGDEYPPCFLVKSDGIAHRVYVTSQDLFVIPLGFQVKGGRQSGGSNFGGGLAGAAAGKMWDGVGGVSEFSSAKEVYKREKEKDEEYLDGLNANALRGYIKTRNKGFIWKHKDLNDVYVDKPGFWERLFKSNKFPFLTLGHKAKGEKSFQFANKTALVIGLYELKRLLGDLFETNLNMAEYKSAMRKYAKKRGY